MVIWKRKVYRIVMGSLCPTLYLISGRRVLPLSLCCILLTLLLALEYARYRCPGAWQWMLRRFQFFKTPPGQLTGETWFMIATFASLLFFSRDVTIAALFFLVFGDAGSALAGTRWGRTGLFRGKTLEGMAGGILANGVVAIGLMGHLSLPPEVLGAGVLVGALAEILPLPLDDNLTMGLSAGLVMSLLSL